MNFSFVLDILKEVSIIFILAILAYFLVQFGNKYIDKNKELHISKKRLAGILLLIFFIVILYFIFMINGLRSIL
ncbi:MAG: hypothetical protein ACTH0S_07810, partial [Senegalia sp. (in: firmicutes)]